MFRARPRGVPFPRVGAGDAAFDPGRNFSYFPSPGELLFSLGLGAAGVLIYVAAVKRLPVLAGVREPAPPPSRGEARAA